MTLPASGTITMGMINTELGKSPTAAISLNDADVRALAGKPSGAISLSDFYGKSNTFVQNFNLTTTNGTVNLRSIADAAGYAGQNATITFIVPNAVTIRGTGLSSRGIDTGTWPAGKTLALTLQINSGGIVEGRGGAGGKGGGGFGGSTTNGTAGSPGGDAIYVQVPITITNAGRIAGGGGGGGGGGAHASGFPEPMTDGGDGGGGGAPNGAGGAAGNGDIDGASGNAGTTSGGGTSGNGGDGGGYGVAGATGTASSGGAGAGGAAGYAIRRNGNAVTYSGAGTKIGTDA